MLETGTSLRRRMREVSKTVAVTVDSHRTTVDISGRHQAARSWQSSRSRSLSPTPAFERISTTRVPVGRNSLTVALRNVSMNTLAARLIATKMTVRITEGMSAARVPNSNFVNSGVISESGEADVSMTVEVTTLLED